jgi:hypothetical protein
MFQVWEWDPATNELMEIGNWHTRRPSDEAFQSKVRFFAIVPKDQFRPLTERWCFDNK